MAAVAIAGAIRCIVLATGVRGGTGWDWSREAGGEGGVQSVACRMRKKKGKNPNPSVPKPALPLLPPS